MLARNKVISAITLFIALVTLWAFYLEPASFKIHEEKVVTDKWSTACNGKRVAILADLHVGSPHKGIDSLKALVKDVNSKQPDLILLPGDFVIQGVVGGEFVGPEAAAAVLAGLRAPMGVYAVLGNHDWWLDAQRVAQALSSEGIAVLEDASRLIGDGACEIRLVGISDYSEGPHNVAQAMAAVARDETVLAFTHNPDIFPKLPANIALTIAGHTHGGQVYLPLIGRPIVPSEHGERYAIGHVIEGNRHLYVSSGVGTSIMPVRFLVAPEVTILALSNH